MSRMLAIAAALAALALSSLSALAGDAYTTRIEPRPFYGATVTLEEGVRVFRALPAHKHIIINPENKTSLNLSYTEERSVHRNYHQSFGDGHGGDYANGSGHGGLTGGYGTAGTPATSAAGADNGVFPGNTRRAGHGGKGPKVINANPGGGGTFGAR